MKLYLYGVGIVLFILAFAVSFFVKPLAIVFAIAGCIMFVLRIAE